MTTDSSFAAGASSTSLTPSAPVSARINESVSIVGYHAALARIAEPITINGQEVHVAASCGVALAPMHAQEALELICDADLALFKAKGHGRGRTVVFATALRMEAVARRLYNIELHRKPDGESSGQFYQRNVAAGGQ